MTLLDTPIDILELDDGALQALAVELDGQAVPDVRLDEETFCTTFFGREGVRAEYVRGEVLLMPPVDDGHNRINVWLIRLLGDVIEAADLGELRYDMWARTGEDQLRIPDLLFVAKARRDIIQRTVIEGPPDAVFEIVSPDSQTRDRHDKLDEYRDAGVAEYWIIDAMSQRVELYRLAEGKYQRVRARDGWLDASAVPGFALRPDWLWQDPLPKLADAAAQLRGKPAGRR